MPTALVAIEQFYPPSQRIVDDPLAYQMLPATGKLFLSLLRSYRIRNWIITTSEAGNPGIWGGLLCRKRYIDQKLLASRTVIEAVVNLGAGRDTRLYRLEGIHQLPMWEVDQPQNVAAKIKRLRKVIGSTPANVKYLAIDFNTEALGSKFASEGFSLSNPTFFIWEGVTQYLNEASVRATFDFLATAAAGSRLAFTYVRKDFLEGKELCGWPAGYKQFVAAGLWQFGLMPQTCAEFIAPYGWRMVEDVSYDQLAEKYVRPTGRRLKSTPVERIVYAEKILNP